MSYEQRIPVGAGRETPADAAATSERVVDADRDHALAILDKIRERDADLLRSLAR